MCLPSSRISLLSSVPRRFQPPRSGRTRKGWTVAAGVLAATFVLLGTRQASANAPQFVAALTGRAADEWQAACATATTIGTACDTTICGAKITIEPGGNPLVRNLVVNDTTYNLHDVATNPVDLAAAALLNSLCAAGGGDPFVAGVGSFAVQSGQIESFMLRSESQVSAGRVPGSVLRVGGAYERGSGSTNGFLLPVSYERNVSDTQFFSIHGSFLYGTRGSGATQADGRGVPGMHQYGVTLTPAYGMEMSKGTSTYALGGYVPIAYSKASLVDAGQTFSAYAMGIGGIGTLTTQRNKTTLSGGLAFAGRKTGGAFTLPVTALVRAVHPLSTMFDGYGSLSYGNDPVGAKTGLLTIAAGAAAGKTEFGIRGFLGSDYKAVLLGFTYTQELEGSFAIEKPAEEPAEKPAEPAPPAK